MPLYLGSLLGGVAQGQDLAQQAAQTPLTAQQYVAGQPAANASAYQTNMGQLGSLYGTLESSAIPYMNQGVGATQNQQAFNANQQAQLGSALGQMGQGLWGQNSTTPSWFSGGSGTGQLPASSNQGFTDYMNSGNFNTLVGL